MKRDTTNGHLKAFYTAKRLGEERLARLRELIDPQNPRDPHIALVAPSPAPHATHESVGAHRVRGATWVTIAAMTTLAVVVAWRGAHQVHRDLPPSEQLAESIADHVAQHRSGTAEIQFPASDLRELAGQMTDLGFEPILPERLAEHSLNIQGSRYCTLLGAIAAQIRFLNDCGDEYMLYEWRAEDSSREIGDWRIEIDGLLIDVWEEDELYFAFARTEGEARGG
ncbi:MAG: hypothetical protein KAS72_13245 [Phycisphaerales bacterium]|nr:hypothetical protein [Phycisphaerales bacterium]